MKAYTKPEHLEEALDRANVKYNNNLAFNRFDPHRNHVMFTLRVASSKESGHRIGFSGRRLVAACWHAHRDFMKELFKLDPDCKLITAWTTYQNADHFEYSFEQTGDMNIGSMIKPFYARHACEC